MKVFQFQTSINNKHCQCPHYPNMIWLVAFLSCIGKSETTVLLCFSILKHCHVFVPITKGLICAKPPSINEVDNRVIGGQNAAPKTWKWQVGNESVKETSTFFLNHIDCFHSGNVLFMWSTFTPCCSISTLSGLTSAGLLW